MFVYSIFYLIITTLMIEILPMKYLKKILGKNVKNVDESNVEENILLIIKIVRKNILRASKIFPWKVKCYSQALTAKLILKKHKIESYLYLGINKKHSEMKAHAWLKVGNIFVIGEKPVKEYKPIAIFR